MVQAPTSGQPSPAYPTEGRERQKIKEKANKLAGIEPNRKKFIIEDKFDDCGSDLSGLGSDIQIYMADYTVETESSDSDAEHTKEAEELTANLSTWWFLGSEAALL